jgi:hypothetical protein
VKLHKKQHLRHTDADIKAKLKETAVRKWAGFNWLKTEFSDSEGFHLTTLSVAQKI